MEREEVLDTSTPTWIFSLILTLLCFFLVSQFCMDEKFTSLTYIFWRDTIICIWKNIFNSVSILDGKNGTQNNTFWVNQGDKTHRHEHITGWASKGKLLKQEKGSILLILELLFFNSP